MGGYIQYGEFVLIPQSNYLPRYFKRESRIFVEKTQKQKRKQVCTIEHDANIPTYDCHQRVTQYGV